MHKRFLKNHKFVTQITKLRKIKLYSGKRSRHFETLTMTTRDGNPDFVPTCAGRIFAIPNPNSQLLIPSQPNPTAVMTSHKHV
jgi:hypothetical protein